MKALILVGGYGTRLRPLTFTVAKPLVPFCNLSICLHQILALIKVGVKTIVLAVNVQPEALIEFCKSVSEKYGVNVVVSMETVPMGTAGPLSLAAHHLLADDSEFFMFNSDVICEFPLDAMLKFHRAHGGEGTICVTKVSDPSKYGVVVNDPASGQIQRFVEKPQTFVGDQINAGIYLFNNTILKRIENRPMSIEREVFPQCAADKQLYCMQLPGYWMDIGQPKDYLSGQVLHLASMRSKGEPANDVTDYGARLAQGPHIVGNVMIHPSAKIGTNCMIGPDVVIGENCVVEDGARIVRSCMLERSTVGKCAYVMSSIIGWDSKVGSHAHVNEAILGEDVQINKELVINGLTVCPHKGVGASEYAPGKILM